MTHLVSACSVVERGPGGQGGGNGPWPLPGYLFRSQVEGEKKRIQGKPFPVAAAVLRDPLESMLLAVPMTAPGQTSFPKELDMTRIGQARAAPILKAAAVHKELQSNPGVKPYGPSNSGVQELASL